MKKLRRGISSQGRLVYGQDFVYENGFVVMTRYYLLKRGFCCKNGCKNCPYKETVEKDKRA